MTTPYSIDEVKDALEERFEEEIFDNIPKPDRDILKWLKNECFACDIYPFFDDKYRDMTLYEYAEKIEENNEQFINGSIFYSPSLTARDLENFYEDYRELCANYSEEFIDRDNIDLSNLDELMKELAINTISKILLDFKDRMDNFLDKHDKYERTVALLDFLEKNEDFKKLIDNKEVLLDCSEDYDSDKYLFDLKLDKSTKEHFKDKEEKEDLIVWFDKDIQEFLSYEDKAQINKRRK